MIDFTVGGTLDLNDPTYITRKADNELYNALIAKEYCYLFNSRQMGKSSLEVRVRNRLREENFTVCLIDISLFSTNISEDSFYYSIIQQILRCFNLHKNFDLKSGFYNDDKIDYLQRLTIFIEDILLDKIKENILISFDEIDSLFSFSFSTASFLNFLRHCYNNRANNPEYNRLTFCLVGVATPSDLIKDKTPTPYNIGKAIELTGFTFEEAKKGLLQGLENKVNNPEQVLKDILQWTGGQPFLTQKICKLVVEENKPNPDINQATNLNWDKIPRIICSIYQIMKPLRDKLSRLKLVAINQLVQDKIINNWESKDEPIHFRYIRDRILKKYSLMVKMLTIYQEILKEDNIEVDDSYEQRQLLLSGLVVTEQNQLKVYNEIYRNIFDENWVESQLKIVRDAEELRRHLSELGIELRDKFHKFEEGDEALRLASLSIEFEDYHIEIAMLLSNISWAYLQLGKLKEAEEKLNETFDCLASEKIINTSCFQKSQIQVHAYHTQGSLSQQQGNQENARESYIEAFNILRDTEERHRFFNEKHNILQFEMIESIHQKLIELLNSDQNSDLKIDEVRTSLIHFLHCHYAPIEEFLREKQWRKADEETYRMMIEKVGKNEIQMFVRSDFKKFPREDLYVLNALWDKYSKGKFSFTKQQKIWKKRGGIIGKHKLYPLIKFWQDVNWVSKGELEDIELKEINYEIDDGTPDGHLPTTGLRFQEISLFSRVNACDIEKLKDICPLFSD